MIVTPRLRNFALTTHVTSSVGWFGAVAGFILQADKMGGVTPAETIRVGRLDRVEADLEVLRSVAFL